MALLVFEQGGLDRGQPVRTAPWVTKQSVAIAGASTASAAFNMGTGLITVCASAACHVEIDGAPTATASSFPLEAGEKADFIVQPGDKIAVIQA